MSERVHRSIMNIKVGMLFYILSLFLAFFSRKVFLDCLGAEFIGLTGMLKNIMSFLSVAELGIGTSIVYFLYKPLQEDNHEKINEVMSMLAYLYRCIGLIIGGIGIVVSLFFPWWFNHLTTELPLVYFAFYSFLSTSMSGYIFNYKQLLVGANQKQYMVSAYFQTIGIVQSLTQIFLAYYYQNLYLWVVVGLIFTIIDSGKPFDPTVQAEVDTSLSADERNIGGLGIHIIRQNMDSINYERMGGLNVLTLRKKIEAPSDSTQKERGTH